jgi:hypothetical protein
MPATVLRNPIEDISTFRRSALRLTTVTVLALAIGACGVQNGPADDTRSAPPSGGYDLTDPDLLTQLGVPNPRIDWSRDAGRVEFVGSGPPASSQDVDLLAAVVSEVPAALDTVAAPRFVVRNADEATVALTHPDAVAFAFGPDVYLLDGSFALSADGSTRFDLARAYIHELAHVAQYLTLSDRYVLAALEGRLPRVDPVAGSTLVTDFADSTGWSAAGDELAPTWTLSPGVAAATTYGATNPGEDMAESLALVMLGLADLISSDRVEWIERWLDASATELAIGRPWAPAGAEVVDSADDLWDAASVETLAVGFEHVEPLYFLLEDDGTDAATRARDITNRLRERLMAGELVPIDDPRVPRFGGRFLRRDGSFLWVELWDFPNAEPGVGGPDRPLLVYVAIW